MNLQQNDFISCLNMTEIENLKISNTPGQSVIVFVNISIA